MWKTLKIVSDRVKFGTSRGRVIWVCTLRGLRERFPLSAPARCHGQPHSDHLHYLHKMTCKISRATSTSLLLAHGIQILKTSLPLHKIAVDVDRVRLVKGAPFTIYRGRLDAHCSRSRPQALRPQHTSGFFAASEKDSDAFTSAALVARKRWSTWLYCDEDTQECPHGTGKCAVLVTPQRTCVS